MSVGLQDVTLSLILFVFLCWLTSVNQQCRAACVYFSEMCGAPAVTWMRWFVWTAAAHIKRKSSSVHFLSGSWALYSNWISYFCFFSNYSFVSVSAFDMLSAWKFTAPCHSSSSNFLMCHSVSYVMNKHADVQRDEHWVSNEIDSLRVSERKGLLREKWQCHGGAEQASSTKISGFIWISAVAQARLWETLLVWLVQRQKSCL